MKLLNFKNAGPGFIVLNIVRACNIICLLSCLASSVVMLVKTFVVSKFFFFDAVTHIITAMLATMLVITETSLFRKWFMHNWPLLSISAGFVTLGLLMVALGTLILGNLNKEATSEQNLGTNCWQLLIASGIITSIFGIVNVVVNFIFRKPKLGVTARMVRAYGATASQHAADVYATAGPRGDAMYSEWHDKVVLPSHNSSITELKRANTAGSYNKPNPNNSPMRAGSQRRVFTDPTHYAQSQSNPYIDGSMQQPAPQYTARPVSTVPSQYAPTELTHSDGKNGSEFGGPRSVSPLSSSHHGTAVTRFPTGRSVSSPTRAPTVDYKQYEFRDSGADVVKMPEATHPAFRRDAGNGWV